MDPKGPGRLAGMPLESLEQLSEEESARLWAEEAQRRDEEMDLHPGSGSSAELAIRDARAKLR